VYLIWWKGRAHTPHVQAGSMVLSHILNSMNLFLLFVSECIPICDLQWLI